MNFLKMKLPESYPGQEQEKVILSPTCGLLRNIGKRPEQQDSLAISDLTDETLCQERGILLTLADGMGGMNNGAQVSTMLVSAMQKAFLSRPVDAAPERWLLELLGEANREVNRYVLGKDPSGSTLTAALIHENKLYFLSVGDSRIYLVRGGGVIPLNREHSYGHKLDLMLIKDILPAPALAEHPQRRALTSYVGMGDLESVDRSTTPITLMKGDAVMLLSDGVFGTLSEEELAACLCSTGETTVIRMERKVLEKNLPNQDNFSAVVLQF